MSAYGKPQDGLRMPTYTLWPYIDLALVSALGLLSCRACPMAKRVAELHSVSNTKHSSIEGEEAQNRSLAVRR